MLSQRCPLCPQGMASPCFCEAAGWLVIKECAFCPIQVNGMGQGCCPDSSIATPIAAHRGCCKAAVFLCPASFGHGGEWLNPCAQGSLDAFLHCPPALNWFHQLKARTSTRGVAQKLGSCRGKAHLPHSLQKSSPAPYAPPVLSG